jgi:Flp pilus assembly protein TadD
LDQDPDAIEVLFAKARVQQERGSPVGEVIQILEDFQRSRKEDPRILHKIALLWVGEGNLLAAKRTVERSLLLIEPNYWPSRTLLARILLEGGDESRARVELEEAINLNPFHPEAYLELGAILRRRGDLAAAEATFLQLLARNPEEANVANNLADLYLAQSKVAEGLQWARVAYAGAPKEPAVLDTLGWALHLSGQLEEAAQLLKRANEGYPDEPEVRLHWGSNLAARGDRTRAQQVLGWVVKSAPDSDAAARAREVLAMLPQPGSASAD